MRYLVTYQNLGLQEAFYSENFDIKDFDPFIGMVVYDLKENKMLVNSLCWTKIEVR